MFDFRQHASGNSDRPPGVFAENNTVKPILLHRYYDCIRLTNFFLYHCRYRSRNHRDGRFGGSVCIKQNINRSIHPGVQHRRAHISYIQRQKPRYPKSFGRQIVHRLAESVPTLCKEKAPGQIRRNLPPRLSDFAIAMPKVRLRTPKSLPEIADCGVEIKRGH